MPFLWHIRPAVRHSTVDPSTWYGVFSVSVCTFSSSTFYASRDNQPIDLLDLEKYYLFSYSVHRKVQVWRLYICLAYYDVCGGNEALSPPFSAGVQAKARGELVCIHTKANNLMTVAVTVTVTLTVHFLASLS
jgi:hypothetical protein